MLDSVSEAAPAAITLSTRAMGWDGALVSHVPCLYAAGNVKLLTLPMVALIGSREATHEGRRRAAMLARMVNEIFAVTVSGLARGIDAAAHEATIADGGDTLAVLGTPLGRVYPPEHEALQTRLMREHLVLSPFEAGTRTEPWHFPLRNRVMANLAKMTIVVEAQDGSGTRHQLDECLRVGRRVLLPYGVAENPATRWQTRYLGHPLVQVVYTREEVKQALLRHL